MSQVSAIIPVYNRKELLSRAIASVLLSQDHICEVLVVNDASTDWDSEFETELLKLSEKIKIIHNQENRGVSFSRNRAIDIAKGSWLAFLDSDDEWQEGKLAKQLELAKKESTKIVHTEEIWIRRGKRVNQMKKHQKFGGDIFEHCLEMCKLSPSSVMIHRDVFTDIGLFNEDFPVCEDFDLWLRICVKYPVSYLPEAYIKKYGGHEDQLSRKYHSMDYWRVKALDHIFPKCMELKPEYKTVIASIITKKTNILLQGYEKHSNFKNKEEVLVLNKKYKIFS